MKGLITAIRTLTIIPVPGQESKKLSAALPWFPVVGLILGLILYAAGRIWMLIPDNRWYAGGALVIVAVEVWLTRGLHLDGLADWADSIGGFGRERRLAIMKDVSLGAFGVIALVLAITAKWLAIQRILSSGALILLPVILALSRGMLVELQLTLPYARTGGGMAGPFSESASNRHRGAAHILTIGICLAIGPLGIVLFAIAGLIAKLLGACWKKQFGGFTGDLLGTTNEITEILLLTLAALLGKNIHYFLGWN